MKFGAGYAQKIAQRSKALPNLPVSRPSFQRLARTFSLTSGFDKDTIAAPAWTALGAGLESFPAGPNPSPFLEIFRAEPLGDTNHANHIVLIRRLSDCCAVFLAAGMGETAAAKSSAPAPGNPIASNPLKIAQLAWYKANTTTTFAVGNEPNVGVVDFRGGPR